MVIKDFQIRQGEICFLGSIADILKHHGCNINEAFLLGMASGLQFRYGYIAEGMAVDRESKGILVIDCVDLVIDIKKFEDLFKYLGVNIDEKRYCSLDDIRGNIESNISQGRHLLIEVDIYYLDYHISFSKIHDAHTIIVYGIEPITEQSWIADSYVTTLRKSTYSGQLPLQSMLQSLDLSKTEADSLYLCWDIYPLDKSELITTTKVAEHIQLSGKQMLYGAEDSKWLNGMTGISELISDLDVISKHEITKEVKVKIETIHKMLTGFGGPTPTRLLYSKFLNWAIEKANIELDSAIAEAYSTLANDWKVASTILLKSAILQNQGQLVKALNRFIDIKSKEEALAKILCLAKARIERQINLDDIE